LVCEDALSKFLKGKARIFDMECQRSDVAT
jgi:hypothetical protein